jgi:hypothetical protein
LFFIQSSSICNAVGQSSLRMCSITKTLQLLWQHCCNADQDNACCSSTLQTTLLACSQHKHVLRHLDLSTWGGKLALKWENINTLFICPVKAIASYSLLSRDSAVGMSAVLGVSSTTNHLYKYMITLHMACPSFSLTFSEKYLYTLCLTICAVKWWPPIYQMINQEKFLLHITVNMVPLSRILVLIESKRSHCGLPN